MRKEFCLFVCLYNNTICLLLSVEMTTDEVFFSFLFFSLSFFHQSWWKTGWTNFCFICLLAQFIYSSFFIFINLVFIHSFVIYLFVLWFFLFCFFLDIMDMESLYDYGEEEQDFYEENPGTRKGGYPIDHRWIKVSIYIYIYIYVYTNTRARTHTRTYISTYTVSQRKTSIGIVTKSSDSFFFFRQNNANPATDQFCFLKGLRWSPYRQPSLIL